MSKTCILRSLLRGFQVSFFRILGRLTGGHFRIEFEEFFQPLDVVLEATTDVDALQRLVVDLVRRLASF